MPKSTAQTEAYPAIVIGAGQAGIALSHCLSRRGIDHLILERDRPFADWYNRRWDSFKMNTPNWMNVLPGEQQPFAPHAPRDAYGSLSDAWEYFEAYLCAVRPPIRIEEVTSVGVNRDGSWEVITNHRVYAAHNVIVCTGHAGQRKLPTLADRLPAVVRQLHSSQYKTPAQIATDNVLIVGSGSSGVQICQELAASGRFDAVSLAESGNFTLPWTVLGISTYALMRSLGIFKITRRSWLGRRMFPKLLQKGDPATPPSPRHLAKAFGVRRVGRVCDTNGHEIECDDGQTVSLRNLTVVWCTGFRSSYDLFDVYIKEGVLDDNGRPRHDRGVVDSASGLYFVGLRFQHTFLSQDLYGMGQDAEFVAAHIAQRPPIASRATSASTSTTPQSC